MKKFISFFVIINLLLINKAVSQYRMPVYNDYLTDNYYVLHPAMAGPLRLRSSYRTQWLGIKNLLCSIFEYSQSKPKIRCWSPFFHDKNGFQSQIGHNLLTHIILISIEAMQRLINIFGLTAALLITNMTKHPSI